MEKSTARIRTSGATDPSIDPSIDPSLDPWQVNGKVNGKILAERTLPLTLPLTRCNLDGSKNLVSKITIGIRTSQDRRPDQISSK